MNEYRVHNQAINGGYTASIKEHVATIRAHGYKTVPIPVGSDNPVTATHMFYINEVDEEGIRHNMVYWEFPVEGTVIQLYLRGREKDDDEVEGNK